MSTTITSCEICFFWKKPEAGTVFGDCRKKSPAKDSDGTGRWPETTKDEWCGDYQMSTEQNNHP